jgi:hypothetical protein
MKYKMQVVDYKLRIRSVLFITEKLHPLQSTLEALKRDTVLKGS